MNLIIRFTLIFGCLFSINIYSVTIAFIADSIGKGVQGETPFPNIIEQYYAGKDIVFVKDCKGGTTIASGYKRLEKLLQSHKIDILVYTLGINDCLAYKTPIENAYANLSKTLQLAEDNNIRVILGMIEATYYHRGGPYYSYAQEFESMYTKLPFDIILFPFLHSTITGDPSLTYDGSHLNQEGQEIVAFEIQEILDEIIVHD